MLPRLDRGLSPSQAGERLKLEIERFLSNSQQWMGALPDRPVRVLDIGCGLGFGTLACFLRLRERGDYSIFDKDEVSEQIYYGYNKEAASYNSLRLSERFLIENGIPTSRLHVFNATDGFPSGEFDLVISHISWGFHYPIGVYFDQVSAATRPGALPYLDLRAGTDGTALLSTKFKRVWNSQGTKSIATAWVRI